MAEPRPFTMDDAEDAGHHLVVDFFSTRILPECHGPDGERCWTFAVTHSLADAERSFLEHAARETGVCWACSQPEEDWPNRERCHRCWLMYHANVHHLLPRDCPPFPGDEETTDGE